MLCSSLLRPKTAKKSSFSLNLLKKLDFSSSSHVKYLVCSFAAVVARGESALADVCPCPSLFNWDGGLPGMIEILKAEVLRINSKVYFLERGEGKGEEGGALQQLTTVSSHALKRTVLFSKLSFWKE